QVQLPVELQGRAHLVADRGAVVVGLHGDLAVGPGPQCRVGEAADRRAEHGSALRPGEGLDVRAASGEAHAQWCPRTQDGSARHRGPLMLHTRGDYPKVGGVIVAGGRILGLDLVRAVGAWLVLLSHVAFWTGRSSTGVVGGLGARGELGVAAFFALSALLLS